MEFQNKMYVKKHLCASSSSVSLKSTQYWNIKILHDRGILIQTVSPELVTFCKETTRTRKGTLPYKTPARLIPECFGSIRFKLYTHTT